MAGERYLRSTIVVVPVVESSRKHRVGLMWREPRGAITPSGSGLALENIEIIQFTSMSVAVRQVRFIVLRH
jgi:hypothetical protein